MRGLGFRVLLFAARDGSDGSLGVEAHSFRRKLGTQGQVHAGCCCGSIHYHDPGVPARFVAEVQPWGEVTVACVEEGA